MVLTTIGTRASAQQPPLVAPPVDGSQHVGPPETPPIDVVVESSPTAPPVGPAMPAARQSPPFAATTAPERRLDCTQLPACTSHGLCSARNGRCVAVRDRDCQQAWLCRSAGACRAANGVCVANDPADELRGTTKPRSDELRWTGIGFTIASSAVALVAIPLSVERTTAAAGAALAGTAGFGAGFGISAWVLGATHIPAERQPQDSSLMAAGLVLASLGLSAVILSTAVLADTRDNAMGVPLAIGGVTAIGGGVMATVGAQAVNRHEMAPHGGLELGLGTARLTLSF